MLYNVLPPLIFFLSFAGIIIVVSRVVMRSRREAFSHSLRIQAGSSSATMPEGLLNPGVANVLLKSRAGLLLASIKNTVSGTKSYFANRKEQKVLRQAAKVTAAETPAQLQAEPSSRGISIPGASWREKALAKIKDSTKGFNATLQKVTLPLAVSSRGSARDLGTAEMKTASVPLQEMPTPVSAKTSPQIRIIRVDTRRGDTSKTSHGQAVTKNNGHSTKPVEGRFIARLKKPQPPQATILEQVSDAIGAGQLEQAEEMLIPYIVKHTKDCQAYMLLGKVAIAKGAWREAMEVFEQVIHLDPEIVDAQASLGYAALQQGKFTIALQALQRAHRSEPENVQILDQLLNIARRLDNKVLQKSVLAQLIELQPDNTKAAENLATLLEAEKSRQSN
ncbi:MAG: tetratricopeptide repeat protein [Candidatus Andersenbacteria bacterium]|nr:tetratricopeptide repeat protein [Candidatus Andersenbacteria bacterium]